ncbi:pyridoxal-phosphate dependent enzyme [Haladaptatus sp. DFWS20]|uniref:pyridoxal-phosphate dependent enzyme n=1 Tax=Haladaptatus sp. DFWS20 TaxID=3403467 RepID=UPI003EBCE4E3
MSVSLSEIREAATNLNDKSIVSQTPKRSRSLEAETNAMVRLKMEHLQRTTSFKTHGLYNKIINLIYRGCVATRVVAASAGNHAQVLH